MRFGDLIMAKLLTLQQVADSLGVSVKTVKREVDDGKLIVTPVRGSQRILEADLAAYIEKARGNV